MKINNYWVGMSSLMMLITFTRCFDAQQANVAAGNTIESSMGSVSFSVGQTHYQSFESASGKVSQGVQQPYEIFVLSTENTALQGKISVYPNPVKDFLMIDFKSDQRENANYQVFDTTGKLILKGDLKNIKNEIDASTLPVGMYILSISNENETLKTYKIIKN